MRAAVRAIVAACILASMIGLAARRASAFADPVQFFARANTQHAATLSASSEGLYFTGAPRAAGLTCRACHTGAASHARLKIGADPPSLFDGYQPGATYLLEVELLDATRGASYAGPASCTDPPNRSDRLTYIQCDNNGFALEIDDRAGPLQDGFCAAPLEAGVCPPPNPYGDEVVISPEGEVALAARAHDPSAPKTVLRNGPTRWHLWWTAPAAGRGALRLFVAAVDGNGGKGTPLVDQDPEGDDVVAATIDLPELGTIKPSGCATGVSTPASSGAALGAILVLIWLRRSARARRLSGDS